MKRGRICLIGAAVKLLLHGLGSHFNDRQKSLEVLKASTEYSYVFCSPFHLRDLSPSYSTGSRNSRLHEMKQILVDMFAKLDDDRIPRKDEVRTAGRAE